MGSAQLGSQPVNSLAIESAVTNAIEQAIGNSMRLAIGGIHAKSDELGIAPT